MVAANRFLVLSYQLNLPSAAVAKLVDALL